MAELVGWTRAPQTSSRRHTIVLISPTQPTVTISVAAEIHQWNDSKWRAMFAKVLRYGDPEKVALEANKRGMVDATRDEAAAMRSIEGRRAKRTSLDSLPVFPVTTKSIADDVLRGAIAKHERTIADAREKDAGAVAAVEAVVAGDPAPLRVFPELVTQQPWMAKRGQRNQGGMKYESQTTWERKWSDGTMDYGCRHPGCEYEAPNPNSVASHYARSKDHPPVEEQPQHLDTDYEVGPAIGPRDNTARVNRLAAEILKALAGLPSNFEDRQLFADALAEAMLSNREGGESHALAEPPTPEQILDKIRVLVDDGSWLRMRAAEQSNAERMAALEAEIEEQREQLAEAQTRAAAAEAQAQSVTEKWDALASLVTEAR